MHFIYIVPCSCCGKYVSCTTGTNFTPIRFYSNPSDVVATIAAKNGFTFQSGSILMIMKSEQPEVESFLYIPIWFYSNLRESLKIIQQRLLYIPIWFYSNIDIAKKSLDGLLALHSNLVLF